MTWGAVRLGDICNPKQWPTISKAEMQSAGFPVYGANGRIGYASRYTHERPTILVGCRGSCGRVHLTGSRAYATGNAMALDALDERRVNVAFLAHFLRFRGFADVITGTSQPQIIRQNLVEVEVPLPPLQVQRRIVEVLDRADTLRAKRQEALESIDELKSAIFVDLFRDTVRNTKGWPHAQLADVLAKPLRNGLSPSNAGSVRAKVLTLSAITGREFDPSAWKVGSFHACPPAEQAVDSADLLICRGNGNIKLVGKGYFPAESLPDVTFPDTVIAARIDAGLVERAFLEHVWNSDSVRRQIQAVARTTNGTFKVNQSMLEGVVFIVPPLSLQREFSAHVTRLRRLRSVQRRSSNALEDLFASVQHRAFRGEL